jgi:chromosome segregation ATPase
MTDPARIDIEDADAHNSRSGGGLREPWSGWSDHPQEILYMQTPVRRTASAVIASAIVGIGLMGGGCDALEGETARADRRAEQAIETSFTERQIGGQAGRQAAHSALQQAAQQQEASPATRAHAKSLLAMSEAESAHHMLREVDRAEVEVVRLAWEIGRLGSQIALSNRLVEGYRLHEPAALREDIAQKVAAARGGPDQLVWIEHDQAQIPTLAAVRQEISRLEGELAQQQQQIEELTQQRTQVVEQAEQVSERLQQLEGRESVEAFAQGSELRKQATDLLTQIETVEAAVVPLERDLAIAQDQQRVLQRLIEELQVEGQRVEEGWAAIQAQIEVQQAIARTVLEGGERPMPSGSDESPGLDMTESITQKAQRLQELSDRLEQERSEVQNRLETAIRELDEAYRAAEELRRDLQLREGPQRDAWRPVELVHNPMLYRLRQAYAEQALAALHAGRVSSLQARVDLVERLGPVLEESGLALPPALRNGQLRQRLQELRAQANEAYEQTDTRLEDVINAPVASQELRDAARVSRIFALYGWSHLALQGGEQQQWRQRLGTARTLLQEVQAEPRSRALLPALLPPGLTGDAPAAQPTALLDVLPAR